jgi:hypothetical protein
MPNARREALRLLGLKAAGHDPASERIARRARSRLQNWASGSWRNMSRSTASLGPPKNISARSRNTPTRSLGGIGSLTSPDLMLRNCITTSAIAPTRPTAR